jgi:hypothetical protein
MKRSIISIFIIGVLLFVVFSCKKDEVYSTKHVYTDAELALKDSLEAAKQNVKANLILKYDVSLPLDTVNYRSIVVNLGTDTVTLLSKLGLSHMSDLNTALGTVTDGVQSDNTITFFAIDASTRYDNAGKLTANGFGHWFDANGDVCSWGTTDRLFSEFDPTTASFNIGQHPKHIKTGEKYKIIQLVKKGDYRVAFIFNVTVGDYYHEVIPVADNVATYNLTINEVQDNNYAATDLTFDYAAAASAMGVSASELSLHKTIYGINADGTKTSAYTADAGYWFTKSGDVCNYGADGIGVYVNYEDGIFHIGQMPNACAEGDSYTVSLAIMYKDTKMVTYKITVKILGYVDPETKPAGDPTTLVQSDTVSLTYTGNWPDPPASIDVKEVLRNAFKMTTYQIDKAIENNELVFSGVNADGTVYKDADGKIVSTAAFPGHWFDASGNVTTFGSTTNVPVCFSELHFTKESLQFSLGYHPDNTKAGDVFTFKQIAELNGGKVTFTFKLKVQ